MRGLAINGNPISTGHCFSPPELDALSFCLLTAPIIEHHHLPPIVSSTPHSSSFYLTLSSLSAFIHIRPIKMVHQHGVTGMLGEGELSYRHRPVEELTSIQMASTLT